MAVQFQSAPGRSIAGPAPSARRSAIVRVARRRDARWYAALLRAPSAPHDGAATHRFRLRGTAAVRCGRGRPRHRLRSVRRRAPRWDRRGSISRILFPLARAAVIPLDRRLPAGSSDVPEAKRGPRNLVFVLLRVGFAARHRHRCRGSSPIVSPTPRYARGRLLSVALSPDRSGPPLAATLPFGVRTFLPPRSEASDCLILSGRCSIEPADAIVQEETSLRAGTGARALGCGGAYSAGAGRQ